MLKIVFSILYLVSCIFLPWYISAIIAIVLIAYFNLWPVAILGGFVIDLAFGAPISIFGNFAYLYTTLFVLLSTVALLLRQRMLE